MKRRLQIAAFFTAFMALATLVTLWDGEPRWEGRKVSEWIVELQPEQPQFTLPPEEFVAAAKDLHDRRKAAQTAIRGIGPDAIPYLLAQLEERKPSAVQVWTEKLFERVGFPIDPPPNDHLQPGRALAGFQALGSNAVSAIPFLRARWNSPTNDRFMGAVFSAMGPVGVEPLMSGLTNSDPMIAKTALWCLSEQTTNATSALTAIRGMLTNSDSDFRAFAIYCYVQIETNRQAAIQVVTKAIRRDEPGRLSNTAAISALASQLSRPLRDMPEVANLLVESLEHADPLVVQRAVSTLSSFGDLPNEIGGRILNLTKSSDAEVRRSAVYFLGRRRFSPDSSLPRLAEMLSADPEEDVRDAALQAMADYGEASIVHAPAFAGEIRQIIRKDQLFEELRIYTQGR